MGQSLEYQLLLAGQHAAEQAVLAPVPAGANLGEAGGPERVVLSTELYSRLGVCTAPRLRPFLRRCVVQRDAPVLFDVVPEQGQGGGLAGWTGADGPVPGLMLSSGS